MESLLYTIKKKKTFTYIRYNYLFNYHPCPTAIILTMTQDSKLSCLWFRKVMTVGLASAPTPAPTEDS